MTDLTLSDPTARRTRLTYSWAFLMFPLLTSVRLSPLIQLACLGLLLILSLVGRARPFRISQFIPILLIFGISATMSLGRGGSPAEWVFLLLPIIALLMASRRTDTETAVRSLVAGVGIYLGANIVGWLAGIQSPASRVRVGLLEDPDSVLGIRVLFPFVRSINEPSILAAAFIAYVIISRRTSEPTARWHWFGVLAAVFVMMASGSRFPAIVLFTIVTVSLAWPRFARFMPTASLAAVSLPYVFEALSGPLDYVSRQLAGLSFFARGQTASEIAGGSSRASFWDAGLTFWSRTPDLHERLVGYGYNGHVQSGVVYTYYQEGSERFLSGPAALTLHNSYLQQMFDTGYIGLAALATGLWLLGVRFAHARQWPACAFIGVLIATSMVEIYLVPAYRTAPILLLVALSAVSPLRTSTAQSLPRN